MMCEVWSLSNEEMDNKLFIWNLWKCIVHQTCYKSLKNNKTHEEWYWDRWFYVRNDLEDKIIKRNIDDNYSKIVGKIRAGLIEDSCCFVCHKRTGALVKFNNKEYIHIYCAKLSKIIDSATFRPKVNPSNIKSEKCIYWLEKWGITVRWDYSWRQEINEK